MPQKKKSKLDLKKDSTKDEHKRELAKLRQRKYRENLKNKPEKLSKILEETRKRSKKRNNIEKEKRENDPEFKRASQAIWRESKRKPVTTVDWEDFQKSPKCASESQKRRRRKERHDTMLVLRSQKSDNDDLRKKVNRLKAMLWRRDKKIQSLPCIGENKPNRKRKIVIKETKYQVQRKQVLRKQRNEVSKRKRANRVIWGYKVELFLSRDTNSKLIPGSTIIDSRKMNLKRDFRKKKGTRVNKRVLRYKMKTLFLEFKREFEDFPFAFSTFSKMKPKFIVTAKVGIKKQKCVCVYHSNLERKIQALNKFCGLKSLPHLQFTKIEHCLQLTVCDHDGKFARKDCIERRCLQCGPDKILDHYAEILGDNTLREETIKWSKWTSVEREKFDKRTNLTAKKTYNEIAVMSSSVEELLKQTVSDLNVFALHDFNMKWQWSQLHEIEAKLPKDDVLLIMDFSENISMEFSEETIASHVKSFGISLFPIAITHHVGDKIEQEAVIILSNDLKHDSHMVRACTHIAMEHMADKYDQKKINTVHRFSDGCAAQFKSRHTMRDVANFRELYGTELICNYGETSEFKNVCDGIGDHVKSPLRNDILRQDLVLTSPFAYYEHVKKTMEYTAENRGDHKMIRRTVYFLDSKDIDRNDEETYGKLLPGLMKVRSVRGVEKGFVQTRNVTCYCFACIQSDFMNCTEKNHVNAWQTKHIRKEKECCSLKTPCVITTENKQKTIEHNASPVSTITPRILLIKM